MLEERVASARVRASGGAERAHVKRQPRRFRKLQQGVTSGYVSEHCRRDQQPAPAADSMANDVSAAAAAGCRLPAAAQRTLNERVVRSLLLQALRDLG